MPTFTQYKDPTDTTRGPSPVIWADFPIAETLVNPSACIHHWDDFFVYDGTAAVGDYLTVADAGGTTATVADEAGATGQPHSLGLLQLDGDGTENDLVGYAWPLIGGSAAMGPFRANGSADWLAFECRFKVDSVANDSAALQIGFVEEGTAAVGSIIDTTMEPLATASVIGFRTDETDNDGLLPFYIEGGGSISEGTAQTIVADTYYKIGFAIKGKTAKWYLNGAEVRSITNVNGETAWPDSDRLCFFAANKVGTGAAAVEMHFDWIRLAYVDQTTLRGF